MINSDSSFWMVGVATNWVDRWLAHQHHGSEVMDSNLASNFLVFEFSGSACSFPLTFQNMHVESNDGSKV